MKGTTLLLGAGIANMVGSVKFAKFVPFKTLSSLTHTKKTASVYIHRYISGKMTSWTFLPWNRLPRVSLHWRGNIVGRRLALRLCPTAFWDSNTSHSAMQSLKCAVQADASTRHRRAKCLTDFKFQPTTSNDVPTSPNKSQHVPTTRNVYRHAMHTDATVSRQTMPGLERTDKRLTR